MGRDGMGWELMSQRKLDDVINDAAPIIRGSGYIVRGQGFVVNRTFPYYKGTFTMK